MRTSSQLIVAVVLAGVVLAIGAYESTRPEPDPEILKWARQKQQGNEEYPSAESGMSERNGDPIEPEPEGSLDFEGWLRSDEKESQGLSSRIDDNGLLELLSSALGNLGGLAGDSSELDESILREQYSEWNFLAGADSLLDDPRFRGLLEALLGRQGNPGKE